MRRITRWLGTLICIAILLAFLYSLRRFVDWTSADLHNQLSLMYGTLEVGWRPDHWQINEYAGAPGWSAGGFGPGLPNFQWWVLFHHNSAWEGYAIPLWIPFAAIAIPTGILWYLDRSQVARRIRQLKRRLRPRCRKRLSLKLVAVFAGIHFVFVMLFLFAGILLLEPLYEFFFPFDLAPSVRFEDVFVPTFRVLFFGTPVWATVWAWLYVRFANRLIRQIPTTMCDSCGYDLSGNTSGICPECGAKVNLADLNIQQAST